MLKKIGRFSCFFLSLIIALLILTAGCNLMAPAQKPDVGPAGKPVESKPNPPFWQRFGSASPLLYDLEAVAGRIFEGINKERWDQAEAGLHNMQNLWQQTKPVIEGKKGVKEADEALEKLTSAVTGKQITASYENLNKFMAAIAEIGKSFKLSPLSDMITVSNAIRNVSFYVEDNNWSKAAAKVKELEGTWEQLKPSMEQIGILGEVTKTHSAVKQLKDAVNAENKGAVENQIANLNESMGIIREYYKGK